MCNSTTKDDKGKDTGKTYLKMAIALSKNSGGGLPDKFEFCLSFPECPDLYSYAWYVWEQLNMRRPSGFSGAGVVTYTDIDAWSRLTGNSLDGFTIEMINIIERYYHHYLYMIENSLGDYLKEKE